MSQAKGEGSVWNVNNWHWEQKNYSKEAENMLRKRIEKMVFERDDIQFSISNISKISGHAEISVRKGKQIVVYEYSVDADWIAESDADECQGSFKITEINESDFDFYIPSITISKSGKIGDKARGLLKKCLKDEVIKVIKDLTDEVRNLDAQNREAGN